MTEEWRIVGEFPAYEVSCLGGLRRCADKFVLTPGVDRRGYPRFTFSERGRKTYRYIHRLVALAFLGEPPPGLIVRHLNGNPGDCRLDNICYGTHADNRQDAIRHGTAQRSGRKFTAEERRAVREAAHVLSSRDLAERFGVTQDHARWVRRRAA